MNLNNAIQIARLSDVGMLREHNEDAVASDLSTGLVILADGMGGYKAGEIASEIAVLTITAHLAEAMKAGTAHLRPKNDLMMESVMLMDAVDSANAAIYRISCEYPQCAGMGTTLVAGIFTNNHLVVGHIGDSRMYRLRGGDLTQLTQDHSFVQELINAGEMTEQEARNSNSKNLVTRALGIDPIADLEISEHRVKIGDIYMLCSDGLTEMVADDEIRIILQRSGSNLSDAARDLVKFANEMGGKDNISVVLARVRKSFSSRPPWVKKILRKRH